MVRTVNVDKVDKCAPSPAQEPMVVRECSSPMSGQSVHRCELLSHTPSQGRLIGTSLIFCDVRTSSSGNKPPTTFSAGNPGLHKTAKRH